MGKFFLVLVVLLSISCLSVHLAASAISTTLISALPKLCSSFTPSCKSVFDVVSGGYCKTKTVKPTVVGNSYLTGTHPCSTCLLICTC